MPDRFLLLSGVPPPPPSPIDCFDTNTASGTSSALRDRDSLPWVCAVRIRMPPCGLVAESRGVQPSYRSLVQHAKPTQVSPAEKLFGSTVQR